MSVRRLCFLVAALFLATPAGAQITGVEVPEMADYDAFLTDLFEEHGVPGAAVAVVKDGRLIYARGFGYSNTQAAELVQPDARFRIASVSKPITSVVAMTLVEDGLLNLDAPAFALLPDLPAPAGQTEDPRLATIRVRDLLQHSGGWDRTTTGYDPMFDVIDIADSLGEPAPAGPESIIRYMRGRPLDFNPGTHYVYSNFGYAVLGAIIERVVGQPYETYARTVLAEAGISEMELGRSLLENRLPEEVIYYSDGFLTGPSVFPPHQTVPYQYGGFHMEGLDAVGAWVASTVDLMRFVNAVDGRTPGPDILAPATIAAMTERPDLPDWNGTPYWYALGWAVDVTNAWWHDGILDGTQAFIVRKEEQGLAWIALCNTWPNYSVAFLTALDLGLWNLAVPTRTWPTHDLFPLFSDTAPTPGGPLAFSLTAAPNPFRSTTDLTLSLDAAQPVRLEVFDALGRRVTVLHDGMLDEGAHRFVFDAEGLSTGLYVVRATGVREAVTHRVTLTR